MDEQNQNLNETSAPAGPGSPDVPVGAGVPPAVSSSNPPRKSKFWLVVSVWALLFFVGVSVVAFTGGTDGHPPLGFILAMMSGIYFSILLLTILILSIIRRLVPRLMQKRILSLALAVAAFILALYLTSPILFNENFVTYASSLVIVELQSVISLAWFFIPVLLLFMIAVTSRIFKIPLPAFWKIVVIRSGYALLLVPLAFMLISLSANVIFAKAEMCELIFGNGQLQKNCYLRLVMKESDIEACGKLQLDTLITGDCVSAIAAYQRNAQICELPPVVDNEWLLSECLARVSILSGDKSLCGRITVEMYRSSCLDPPDLEALAWGQEAEDASQSLVGRINKFLQGGVISFVDR